MILTLLSIVIFQFYDKHSKFPIRSSAIQRYL